MLYIIPYQLIVCEWVTLCTQDMYGLKYVTTQWLKLSSNTHIYTQSADQSHTLILGFSKNLFWIMWNNNTVVGIRFSGHSCEYGIYVWLILIIRGYCILSPPRNRVPNWESSLGLRLAQ